MSVDIVGATLIIDVLLLILIFQFRSLNKKSGFFILRHPTTPRPEPPRGMGTPQPKPTWNCGGCDTINLANRDVKIQENRVDLANAVNTMLRKELKAMQCCGNCAYDGADEHCRKAECEWKLKGAE